MQIVELGLPDYEPYLISDFRTGQQENRKPWLLPQDAFKVMKNAYLYQGVLCKRNGYKEWGRLVNAVVEEVVDIGDGAKTYGGTLAHIPIRPGDLVIADEDAVETFTDDGEGVLTGSDGGSGTINYTSGVWTALFNANVTIAKEIWAAYSYWPDLPVMGIDHYATTTGVYDLVAFTTKRMCIYNTTSRLFEDKTGVDTWTGENYNFFGVENYLNKFYIYNGKDRLKSWDGSTVADVLIDIDGDADNDVTTCLQVLRFKDRLLLFRTTEGGGLQPQRVRWPKPGTLDYSNDGYLDAPTTDWFMVAGFLGDELVAFFEWSVWALKYTGDPNLPFRWERIDDTDGSLAPMSLTGDSERLYAVGPTSIVETDGLKASSANENIPEAVLEMAQDKVKYCFGARLDELRQVWFTYPNIGSATADGVLVFNYDDKSWSKYALAIHCMAFFTASDDPTFADFLETVFSEEERPSWTRRSRWATR